MHSKDMVNKPSFSTIWYIKCNSVLDKIGMEKYPQKYCVFMKDTLIEIKGGFA